MRGHEETREDAVRSHLVPTCGLPRRTPRLRRGLAPEPTAQRPMASSRDSHPRGQACVGGASGRNPGSVVSSRLVRGARCARAGEGAVLGDGPSAWRRRRSAKHRPQLTITNDVGGVSGTSLTVLTPSVAPLARCSAWSRGISTAETVEGHSRAATRIVTPEEVERELGLTYRPLLDERLAPQESRAPLSLLPRRVARASAVFALWGPGLMAAGPVPQAYSDSGDKTKEFR